LSPPQLSQKSYFNWEIDSLINERYFNGKNIGVYYIRTDSTGFRTAYASYDNTTQIAVYKTLGLTSFLFILSMAMCILSSRVYKRYFAIERKVDFLMFFIIINSFLILFFINAMSIATKGIPYEPEFIVREIASFPNEFSWGLIWSSLLLWSFTLYRFASVAFIPIQYDNTEQPQKENWSSIIGFIFSVIGAVANILKILEKV
jgi:hypothetical protein